MPTILSFLSGRQITNDSGVPQAGAKVFHFRATTTTPLTVWQNSGATVSHAHPVVCDAGGFVPLIYVDQTFAWKIVVTTAAGVTLPQYNFDNIPAAPTDASAAGFSLLFTPWIPVTAGTINLTPADAGNAYEADTTSADVNFSLPDAASVGNGRGFIFKKMTAGANEMNIDADGTQTIDGVGILPPITVQYTTVALSSDGANWNILWFYEP